MSILLVVALWYLSALSPGFQGQAPSVDAGQIASHLLYLVPLTGHSWI